MDTFTSLEFLVPTLEQISTYLLLGLSSGYVWVLDARVNQFLYAIKVLDCGVRFITTTTSKIIVEGNEDSYIHYWVQG